ncbi:unnamed protein product [Prunus armeniaca]
MHNHVISLPTCRKHLQATHKATCEKGLAHDLTSVLAWARRGMYFNRRNPREIKLTIAAMRIVKKGAPLPTRREIFTKG